MIMFFPLYVPKLTEALAERRNAGRAGRERRNQLGILSEELSWAALGLDHSPTEDECDTDSENPTPF